MGCISSKRATADDENLPHHHSFRPHWRGGEGKFKSNFRNRSRNRNHQHHHHDNQHQHHHHHHGEAPSVPDELKPSTSSSPRKNNNNKAEKNDGQIKGGDGIEKRNGSHRGKEHHDHDGCDGSVKEKEKEKESSTGGSWSKKVKFSKSRTSASSKFSVGLKFGGTPAVKSQNQHYQVVSENGDQQCASTGWPAWLSAVAAEAINGWVPLSADSYEKLDKIGQGTYSTVFRAREIATGKIVALKKVRFDNFHPESVRFMAREISILRRLDHPNVIKLQGLITSKLSSSIYLVFDYMEHDLSGLISCPEAHFTESQIKCFMQQLLSGLEYCHKRGVMHRDIKTANILISSDGVLKIADFGLANYISTRYRQPLTSRVVTLWYRPPELLLGSTNYGPYVDLWSVGCVFLELLTGKVVLKGKTEVEQLHKIFKLCGSPPEDYWMKSKLPHATMFKPQCPYESTLRERFCGFSKETVMLLESLLSVEPQFRGTAASALASEYFSTMPYACDVSSLPKYPPNKEMDAKSREVSMRRKPSTRVRESASIKAPRWRARGLQEHGSISMLGRPRADDKEAQIKEKCGGGGGGTNSLFPGIKKGDDL